MYHHVLTMPDQGRPVAYGQIRLEALAAHLERLRGRLLDPRAVHEQIVCGHEPEGVLLTFDDGASGLLDAADALRSVGAVAAAFICPDAATRGLWFYRLAEALARTDVGKLKWGDRTLTLRAPAERRTAYRAISPRLFRMSPGQRDETLAGLFDALQVRPDGSLPTHRTLDTGSLKQLADTGAYVFANHSWSHPDLTCLSDMELRGEVEDADGWLRDSGLPVVPWFAFPRGMHDERVRAAVREVCPVAFSALPLERAPGVRARVGMSQLDAHPWRFAFKTAWGGRLACWRERIRGRRRMVGMGVAPR